MFADAKKCCAFNARKVPIADDVDLRVLARGTPGFSGADLANMVNEAALNAARYNRKSVLMIDFEQAKDKVLMGAERKSMLLTDEEKARHGLSRSRTRSGGCVCACMPIRSTRSPSFRAAWRWA